MIPVNLYPMGGNADEKRLAKGIWTSKDWVVERKFDGQRYLLVHDMDGSVRVTSRTKSEKNGLPVDKAENVPHLVEMMQNTPKGTVLDGEVITHVNCHSSDVTEIMGALPELALERQKDRGFVIFVAYDILYLEGESLMDMGWEGRRKMLEYIIKMNIGLESPNVMLSSYFHCHKFDAQKWYEEIVESGGEGVMLKRKASLYTAGEDKMKKPANVWVKVKKWVTADVIITGFEPAEIEYTGKEVGKANGVWSYWSDESGAQLFKREMTVKEAKQAGLMPITRYHFNGWIGSVVFSQYHNGKMMEVGRCSGMKDEVREYLTLNQSECMGRVIEVKAMERIKKTLALRHPEWNGFRDDKLPEECVIGEF